MAGIGTAIVAQHRRLIASAVRTEWHGHVPAFFSDIHNRSFGSEDGLSFSSAAQCAPGFLPEFPPGPTVPFRSGVGLGAANPYLFVPAAPAFSHRLCHSLRSLSYISRTWRALATTTSWPYFCSRRLTHGNGSLSPGQCGRRPYVGIAAKNHSGMCVPCPRIAHPLCHPECSTHCSGHPNQCPRSFSRVF
jgi:hypothetical protein